jgi:cation diffusion facilitator family transporter
MPSDSTRTVLVALGAGLGVALAKVGAAVFTGSTALAAEAAHSLADSGNDLSLYVAQRRSSRPRDDQHPLGNGREAYFWALIAALGVFVVAAAFSLREGIDELIHPSATSSFAVAYVVLAISTVLDLVSFRQSAGQMVRRARHYHREFLEETRMTSDPSLRAVFVEDTVSVSGDLVALAALALNQTRFVHTSGSGRGAHRTGADPRQSPAHPAQSRLPSRLLDGERRRAGGPRRCQIHPATPASRSRREYEPFSSGTPV